MLIRIVRMTFKSEHVPYFLGLFKNSQPKILAFDGCSHVELLQDYNQKNVFSTYSIWESEEHLDAYRNSELFEGVWKNTKALFDDKPVAFSLKKYKV